MIFVVMGVSGSGKTEVGSLLADQDRYPWLCSLHELLKREKACGHHVVLACSALKKAYRKTLTTGQNTLNSEDQGQRKEDDISSCTLFIHLQGSMELISERLRKRKGHFMPSALLQSQFDTLEPPAAPELFMTVNVEKDIAEIVSDIKAELESRICRQP
ncbi:probable gluconokinase isoform X2 [Dendropsophus ebraccatus]|uniref:probable gluconokinase isoform X2 n=1 Tax=Dendropsophus ebraccatus TaxID=150705 RepID=UPI0038310108